MFLLLLGAHGSKGRPHIWTNSLISPLAQKYLHPTVSPTKVFPKGVRSLVPSTRLAFLVKYVKDRQELCLRLKFLGRP